LRRGGVADDERWKDDPGYQPKSHWHSPFENRVSAAGTQVGQFCDDSAGA
jgi:hypothetical protein